MQSRFVTEPPLRAVDLAFDVIRAELPVSDLRESRNIWNHVDELRADPELMARLARNGVHMGVASSGSWPAMLAILEAGRAEFRREQLFPQRGLPLAIGLGTLDGPESIFRYDNDDRLVGRTFPAGERILNVDYAFHPHLGGTADTRLHFEIRHDRGVMTWERNEGVIRQVPAVDRHRFTDLTIPITIKPGEFIAVGPNAEADNAYLLGNRFLVQTRGGIEHELLLFITPRPLQVQTAQTERNDH